jgi:uncharacterized hydrophobic protein (TIGR00271 family)
MLHVRLNVPAAQVEPVLDVLDHEPTVVNLIAVSGVSRQPAGDLVMFDVARESASVVIERLRALDLHRTGAIAFDEVEVILSDAADRAEKAAPGQPADAVIWDEVEAQIAQDSKLSWSFTVFLILATLIAGIGRYLDQPILIVAAMVVGPEFVAVAAICFGLTRSRVRLAATAIGTLAAGFGIAITLSVVWWWTADAFGWISRDKAGSGPQTDFIIHPDVWSFVIALLAGVAGVLSLTAAKSSTLVGVFISVTTVPAAGTIGLTVATGLWNAAWHSLLQLLLNIGGMLLSGTLTLLVQRAVWARIRMPGGATARVGRRT